MSDMSDKIESLVEANPYDDRCPNCGGEPDNGFDRCVPPSPYYCTKCEEK